MSAVHDRDEAQERAALYVIGALPADEAADFEAHLATGCTECRAAVDDFAVVAGDLAAAAPLQDPPAGLRARVLERIAAESAGDVVEKNGQIVVRAKAPWTPQPALGIDHKPLHVDPASGRATQLVRLPAGGRYPRHRHSGTEEIYLVEGDLMVSGVEMKPGDYCRAQEGSLHDGISTRGGCVFLVHSSLYDEIFFD